jgi:regulator of sirC expression with transglutaminase-like and TPR domain
LTLMSQGQVKAAKICFDYCIDLNPLQADAYRNRGLVLELLNIDACEDFKSACLFGDKECCDWEKQKCN